jgi:large subunit ribosomal protein L1
MAAVAKRQKAGRTSCSRASSTRSTRRSGLIKEFATAKFDETVEVAVNLGVDASKSDQQVRGSTLMPHGLGKKVRVAVFTQGKNADAAREAGADIVGFEDLAERVKAGEIDFDVVIASPDAMRVVGQLGQILGPRGLMPNPKVGTVTPDVAGAVRNAKAGQARYRCDKGGIVHARSARPAFEVAALQGKPAGAARRPAEGQAVDVQGCLRSARDAVLDDGSGIAVDRATLGL